MKKNMSSQSMDAVLQDFLGNKPSKETPKSEPQLADTQEQASEAVQEQVAKAVSEQEDETPQVVRRISGKQRRASLEEYKDSFLSVPSIEDRKPVFLSRSTRDALRIKRRTEGMQFGVTLNPSNGVLRGASLCFGHTETSCSHSETPWSPHPVGLIGICIINSNKYGT